MDIFEGYGHGEHQYCREEYQTQAFKVISITNKSTDQSMAQFNNEIIYLLLEMIF